MVNHNNIDIATEFAKINEESRLAVLEFKALQVDNLCNRHGLTSEDSHMNLCDRVFKFVQQQEHIKLKRKLACVLLENRGQCFSSDDEATALRQIATALDDHYNDTLWNILDKRG